MSAFISSSSCQGRRPKQLSSRRVFLRSSLVARLLQNRQVARFVIAPDGFGKSNLACAYADTVFSFSHVFWVNGKSPCFLRDLDLGSIASEILRADDAAALAVFDDLPQLNSERAALFSQQIDALLAQGCEVLVCLTPSRDAYQALQRDRMRLIACDLLLEDDERVPAAGADETPSRPGCRVAGLQEGVGLSQKAFLRGVAEEELPAETLLGMLVMLALGEGSLDEMGAFGSFSEDTWRILHDHYPFIDVSESYGRFNAPWFAVEDVAAAFMPRLDGMLSRSHFTTRASLVCALADALVVRDEGERACKLVGLLCPHADKGAWLQRSGETLAKQACFLPASDLLGLLGGRAKSRTEALEADEAWRQMALGDMALACKHARRAATSCDDNTQIRGLLVLERCGDASERNDACRRLDSWKALLSTRERKGDESRRAAYSLLSLRNLALLPSTAARRAWKAVPDADVLPEADVRPIAALWLFQDASGGRLVERPTEAAGLGGADRALLVQVANYIEERMVQARGKAADSATAFALLAWLQVCKAQRLSVACEQIVSPASKHAAQKVEQRVLLQRGEVSRRRQERENRLSSGAYGGLSTRFGTVSALTARTAAERGPMLSVKLFGGLEASIGDAPLAPEKLRRQKVKTLLAFLVLARGKDIARDRLISLMWPHNDFDSGRKNFYNIWSILRSALTLPNGTCPYLVRQQNVCRVESSLLTSDLAAFDEVCRLLMFGSMGSEGWARLSSEIDRRFSEELMPGERKTEALERMRIECRFQLVDGLVAATRRLIAEGYKQEGLWFARAALKRDSAREDVYVALMQAQLAAGQRTAALETYFACRRFLAENLGIDPSPETMQLYQGIIESEVDLT